MFTSPLCRWHAKAIEPYLRRCWSPLSLPDTNHAVALVHANWPDVLVGAMIAGLFLKGAIAISRDALTDLRKTPA